MKLKTIPEDFLVDEVPLNDLISNEESGRFTVCKLTKKNYTLERALTHIASHIGIPRKFLSAAGTKDKQAVTTQFIAIKGKPDISKVELEDITLEVIGYRNEPLGLGDLKGNRFTIVVRDLDVGVESVPTSFVGPNYFDEQRFSTHNVAYGLMLLRKEYKELIDAMVSNGDEYADAAIKHLESRENDYIGGIRTIPQAILKMYVHAVQSLVFNESLAAYVLDLGDLKTVPYSQGEFVFPEIPLTSVPQVKTLHLIGYTTEFTSTETDVLDHHGLTRSSFLIKSFPGLTLEGEDREAFISVKDIDLKEAVADDRNEGKLKQEISFVLPKSSYATIVIKQLFL